VRSGWPRSSSRGPTWRDCCADPGRGRAPPRPVGTCTAPPRLPPRRSSSGNVTGCRRPQAPHGRRRRADLVSGRLMARQLGEGASAIAGDHPARSAGRPRPTARRPETAAQTSLTGRCLPCRPWGSGSRVVRAGSTVLLRGVAGLGPRVDGHPFAGDHTGRERHGQRTNHVGDLSALWSHRGRRMARRGAGRARLHGRLSADRAGHGATATTCRRLAPGGTLGERDVAVAQSGVGNGRYRPGSPCRYALTGREQARCGRRPPLRRGAGRRHPPRRRRSRPAARAAGSCRRGGAVCRRGRAERAR
jgi:hypothetical protein